MIMHGNIKFVQLYLINNVQLPQSQHYVSHEAMINYYTLYISSSPPIQMSSLPCHKFFNNFSIIMSI
jgi:hypothetical protein